MHLIDICQINASIRWQLIFTKSWNLNLRSLEMIIKPSGVAVMSICLTNMDNLNFLVGGNMPDYNGLCPQTPLQLEVAMWLSFDQWDAKERALAKSFLIIWTHSLPSFLGIPIGRCWAISQLQEQKADKKRVERKAERPWFSSGFMICYTCPKCLIS